MSNTDVAKDAPKGERKERKGGKGGEKRGGRKGGEKGGDGAREGGCRGEGGKGGKGNRPRKPRAEIPTFEDPEAELAKVEAEGEPPRANRDSLDRKIAGIQNEIDASKRRTEAITRDLDAIKEKNEKLKSSGSGPLEKSREVLRELKKQIVGVIEERKSVSAQIDNIREKKKTMDEQIQKQKAAIGRFTSNEMIDEEIRRIEDHMAHNTMDLKQEKAYMLEIKELNKKRDEVPTATTVVSTVPMLGSLESFIPALPQTVALNLPAAPLSTPGQGPGADGGQALEQRGQGALAPGALRSTKEGRREARRASGPGEDCCGADERDP